MSGSVSFLPTMVTCNCPTTSSGRHRSRSDGWPAAARSCGSAAGGAGCSTTTTGLARRLMGGVSREQAGNSTATATGGSSRIDFMGAIMAAESRLFYRSSGWSGSSLRAASWRAPGSAAPAGARRLDGRHGAPAYRPARNSRLHLATERIPVGLRHGCAQGPGRRRSPRRARHAAHRSARRCCARYPRRAAGRIPPARARAA